jgi:hypothetical protein
MAVKAVVFDVGETLVDETRQWEEVADASGVPRFTYMALAGAAIARGEQPVRAHRAAPRDCLHRFSLRRRGVGADRGAPWRALIGRPSAGQRPVAAPGASHRREALVSRGPSARQATLALSRRWSTPTRRYVSRQTKVEL